MAPIAGPLPRRRHRRLRREAVPGSRALADPGSARMSAAASRPLSPVAPWTFEAALEHVESDPDLLAGLLELPRAERAPAVRPHSHRARPQRPRGARDAGSPPRGHRRAVEAMRAVDAARDIEHLGRQRLVRRYGRPPSSVSFARRTPWGWRRSRGSVTPRGRRSVQRRDAQHRLDRRLPEAPHHRGVRCPAPTTAWRRRYSSGLSRATPALTIGAGRPRLLRQGPPARPDYGDPRAPRGRGLVEGKGFEPSTSGVR
jgi:hypothetical protein